MPEYTHFRLGEQTLAQLDALAASAGSRAQAVREAVAYWQALVREAGECNARELSLEDWARLGHIGQPDVMPDEVRDEGERTSVRDWCTYLAVELHGQWEGRTLVLPYHREEAKACRALAKRIGGWGMVRGYALFACLRHFWRAEGTADGWWRPEVWMGG